MSVYRTARDIVIPAGTPLFAAPARIDRSDIDGHSAMVSGKPAHFVEAIIGPTKDTTYSWTMHIDDALEASLIEPASDLPLHDKRDD